MSLLREAEPGAGLGTLCGLFDYSRQTYYKRGEDNDFKALALEPMTAAASTAATPMWKHSCNR